MPPDQPSYPLFHGQSAFAWHGKTSQDIQTLAGQGAIPILPVTSLCRWQEDWPLDAEEILVGSVLSQVTGPVLPPFRHCPQQDPRQTLTHSASTAWAALEEALRSVQASGFSKCIVLHGHSELADWMDCGLRDLRIETGMGLYRISLNSLGVHLDDEAQRSELSFMMSQSGKSHPLLEDACRTFKDLLAKIEEHPQPPPLRTGRV